MSTVARWGAAALAAVSLLGAGAESRMPAQTPAPVPSADPPVGPELRLAEMASEGARTRLFLRQVKQAYELVQFVEAVKDLQDAAAASAAAAAVKPTPGSSQVSSGSAPAGDVGNFLACTQGHESGGSGSALDGDYTVHSSNGKWHGAYQFEQPTWDSVVSRHGRGDLVGVNPADASPADQDAAATWLYAERGNQPWGGRC